MREVEIRGKIFTEDEVIDYGKRSIARTRRTLFIIGIALLATCVILAVVSPLSAATGTMVNEETGAVMSVSDAIGMSITGSVVYGVPAIILLVLSFTKAKKDPYAAGIKYLNRHFPCPVGFDGKEAEVLQGDKTIRLSSKPSINLVILSTEKKFQIIQNRKYSRIFTHKDVLGYEIKVDNEVVITSTTVKKNGVGKALVGGALFGGVGLVAGAIAGNRKSATSQSQREVHHYTLLLRVNDIFNPSFVVEMASLQVAEEVVATFAVICHTENSDDDNLVEEKIADVPKLDDTYKPEIEENAPKMDKFEEIKKYKELYDMGIISWDEFEIEKKRILK